MTQETSPRKTLPKREFFGYAVGFMGPTTLLALVGMLLNLYYIYVIGLNAFLSGIGLSIGLLTYSIFALIWGNISDNFTGKMAQKYGKRRPFMAFALLPMVLTFFLLWVPPVKPAMPDEMNWEVAAWLWAMSFLFHFFFSAFSPPYWALMPEISTDEDERVRLSMVQNLLILVGNIFSILVPMLLLAGADWDASLFWAAGGGVDTPGTRIIFQMTLYSVFFVALTAASVLIMVKTVREPPLTATGPRHVTMGQFIRGVFAPLKKDPDFTKWQAANFVINIASRILLLDIWVFIRNIIKLEGVEWFIFLAVIIPVGAGSFVIFDRLKRKLGLKQVYLDIILFAAILLLAAAIFFVDFSKDASFGFGLVFVSLGIAAIVGMMIFPTPVNSAFVDKGCALGGCDRTELSGKYSGIYLFFLYLSSSLASLVYTGILDALGPENPVAIVLALPVSGIFILAGFFLFRKADLSIPQKLDNKNR